MFNFILKVLSPPVVRGGWDQPQHSVYAAALTEFKSAYVKVAIQFFPEVMAYNAVSRNAF